MKFWIRKYVLAVGYGLFIAMMLDLPSHFVFRKCINPINLIACQFTGKDPNKTGNEIVHFQDK